MSYVSLLCLATLLGAGEMDEWRDAFGNFRRQAAFVAALNGQVKLQGADGRTPKIALRELAPADEHHCVTLLRNAEPSQPATATAAEPVALQLQDQAAADMDAEAARLPKLAYHAYCGQFHLLSPRTPRNGTALYFLGHERWMSSLRYTHRDAHYLYYHPEFGHPHVTEWAFQYPLNHCCGQYWIYYRNAAGHWHPYGCATVEKPR